MLLEAKRWIEAELPWWRRRQGRDHIWYAARPVRLACVASWTSCFLRLVTWQAYSALSCTGQTLQPRRPGESER